MKTEFKCTCCDIETTHQGVTTIKVRDGQVRLYGEDGEPIDICPECSGLMEEIKQDKGFCTSWSKTAGGVVGGDWSGSASKK